MWKAEIGLKTFSQFYIIYIKIPTSEVNTIDYLITGAHVKEWMYLTSSEKLILKVDVMKAGKMGMCKDLNDFNSNL